MRPRIDPRVQHAGDFKVMFIPTLNPGDVYYRIINYAKYMRKAKKVTIAYEPCNYNDEMCYKWENLLNQDNNIVGAKFQKLIEIEIKPDMIVMQKVYTPKGLAFIDALKQIYKLPIYCESDDYNIGINAENYASKTYYPGSIAEKVFIAQIKLCDGMIVSTPFLKQEYGRYNRNIKIIGNGIDFEIWDNLIVKKEDKIKVMSKVPVFGKDHLRMKVKLKAKKKDEIRIGWAGGQAHAKDLLIIKDAIRYLTNKYKNVTFYFGGGAPDDFKRMKHVTIQNVWVPINEYPQLLKDMRFDIGVFPLLANNFNFGKSNLRWLEYSALKVPTVASDIAEAHRTIDNGKTGFLVKNETSAWIEALKKLIRDKQLRLQMGERAYRTVKRDHNVKVIAKEYIEHLQRRYKLWRSKRSKR